MKNAIQVFDLFFFFLNLNQIIDRCAELSEEGCSTCLATGCGWCDNRYCLEGNSSGPVRTQCEDWIFGEEVSCTGTLIIFVLECICKNTGIETLKL